MSEFSVSSIFPLADPGCRNAFIILSKVLFLEKWPPSKFRLLRKIEKESGLYRYIWKQFPP